MTISLNQVFEWSWVAEFRLQFQTCNLSENALCCLFKAWSWALLMTWARGRCLSMKRKGALTKNSVWISGLLQRCVERVKMKCGSMISTKGPLMQAKNTFYSQNFQRSFLATKRKMDNKHTELCLFLPLCEIPVEIQSSSTLALKGKCYGHSGWFSWLVSDG